MPLTVETLPSYIDHTVLRVDTTREVLATFCEEAITHHFASVCVNPANVSTVSEMLADSGVRTCTVVGFPLGANHTAAKSLETELALGDGAEEIDMVINVGHLKDHRFDDVRSDIAAVVRSASEAPVKTILETAVLTDDEIITACKLAVEAGAGYVKTSTGFGPGGATTHAVALMHRTVAGQAQVKASTGISDLATLQAMVEAGASRIGTSKGVLMLKELADLRSVNNSGQA